MKAKLNTQVSPSPLTYEGGLHTENCVTEPRNSGKGTIAPMVTKSLRQTLGGMALDLYHRNNNVLIQTVMDQKTLHVEATTNLGQHVAFLVSHCPNQSGVVPAGQRQSHARKRACLRTILRLHRLPGRFLSAESKKSFRYETILYI